MSRRSDYMLALSVAVQKDGAVVAIDAVRVLERAARLPEERFPELRAEDVRQFVRYALGDAEAPAWVEEAREEQAVDDGPRLVVRPTWGQCSETWVKNAGALHDTLSDDLRDVIGAARRSAGPGASFMLTPEQWERLQEWVASIPGELECERPYEVDEGRAEDHDDEG